MFEFVSFFRGFDDRYEYEAWKINFEGFFSYFSLTTEGKYHYARLKLDEEAYYWWRDNHKLCWYWFSLQVLLCTRYASPIYSPRLDSSEPNVEQETGSEIQPIIEPFTAKVEVDLKPSFIGEPDVLDESESEIVVVLIPLQEETLSRPTEVQEPFVEISVNLSA